MRHQKPIQRGGTVIDTGKIGYAKPIRQEILLPGETIKGKVTGQVNMETLRERDILRLHAHIAVFMTPIRWLEPNWTDYIKGGPELLNGDISTVSEVPAYYGLGGNAIRAIPLFFKNAPLRIYNEWYKWPESADLTSITEDGFPAVNLEHTWTRCRDTVDPSEDFDKTVYTSGGNFTIKDLALTQARFRSAMDREILSYNRYIELLRDMYGADGSREVDQVPILIEQSELGVKPRSLAATDNAGLGSYASVYDFGVNFNFKVSAPEHCVLTYMLTIRFAPITEEINPHIGLLDWSERVGDPEILASSPPVAVSDTDMLDDLSLTHFGYLPAGWQWRSGWNQIGKRMDVRDSFPVMQRPANITEARDATRRVQAFRSSSLGDYQTDLFISQQSYSPISSAMSSYMAGMKSGSKADAFPKTGKVK